MQSLPTVAANACRDPVVIFGLGWNAVRNFAVKEGLYVTIDFPDPLLFLAAPNTDFLSGLIVC